MEKQNEVFTIEHLTNANKVSFQRKVDNFKVVYVIGDGFLYSEEYREANFEISDFVEIINDCLKDNAITFPIVE